MLFSHPSTLFAAFALHSLTSATATPQPSSDTSNDWSNGPDCFEECEASASTTLGTSPFCAFTDQDSPEVPAEVRNAFACLCTDKTYLRTIFTCALKSCKAADVSTSFEAWYGMCKNAGGVEYPSPERFLAAIGVKGVEVAEVGGYETNSVFSAHTATTWAPTSMWPTEKSILQTATATSDDGEVRFTGTEVVTGSGVEAKITVEASAESGSAALSAVNSASTGERVRVVGAAFAAVVMAGVVAVL